MTSGNFLCTIKHTCFNCCRLCLPPQTIFFLHRQSSTDSPPQTVFPPQTIFQLFSAACKNPFWALVSFPGSRERRDFYCRHESENKPFLAQRSRTVTLAWYIPLSFASIRSLLSVLVGSSEPVYPQSAKTAEVGGRGWLRLMSKMESRQISPGTSSAPSPWSDESLLLCFFVLTCTTGLAFFAV